MERISEPSTRIVPQTCEQTSATSSMQPPRPEKVSYDNSLFQDYLNNNSSTIAHFDELEHYIAVEIRIVSDRQMLLLRF